MPRSSSASGDGCSLMTATNDVVGTAASWLIRLEAQTTPQVWDEFQAWIEADRRNEAAFIRLRTAWTRCDRFKLLRPADGRVDRDVLGQLAGGVLESESRARLQQFGSRALEAPPINMDRRRWLVAAGAVAALGAGPGLLAWLTTRRYRWTYYETGMGDNRQTMLSDRSSVFLNTDSRVRVRLASARRDSELLRGEALFTIARDKLRPFYVKAAGSVVCALGTSFSVRIREDRSVEVLVADGRVAIGAERHPSAASPVLDNSAPYASAGDTVLFGQGSWTIKHPSSGYIARKLAWTTGRISFDGETLTEAVHEFNRYNHRRLEIVDPAIAQIRVGGLFDATDPESFAATLEKHFGVRRKRAARGNDEVIRLVRSGLETIPAQP
jgi:transmembrane sensor